MRIEERDHNLPNLADIDNPEEVGWNDPNCELDHPVHGSRIRDINKLHETLRCAFGRSVRHLPVDRETVTEVLRLTLETSGYYLVYNNVSCGDINERTPVSFSLVEDAI